MDLENKDNPLTSLGFTELEAGVYTLMLEQAPITGYGIAKALGKPAANTYKALESLERKGAVVVEEGASRLYRPVAPESLLTLLDERYQRLRRRAAGNLADLHRASQDDRVYRIRSRDQVLGKARSMIERAREIALVDGFPGTLETLEEPLRCAVDRGVLVGIRAYAPTTIEGAIVAVAKNAESIRKRWPGRWLNLVVDGNEYLMALLSADGNDVVQAVWTESPYLAWVHQSAFSAEIILTALEAMIAAGATTEELKAASEELSRLKKPGAPGYRSIMRELDGRRSQKGDD